MGGPMLRPRLEPETDDARAETPITVLVLEDQPDDAELEVQLLRRSGFKVDWHRVEHEAEYCRALDNEPDIILGDYTLPQFDALRALEILAERGSEIPFVVVTGTVNEETAVQCMKQGAVDYVLKDRLTRLGQAVKHALESSRLRREKKQAQEALRLSEARFRHLAENARDVIYRFRLDPTPGFEYVSPSCVNVLGFSADELYQNPQLAFRLLTPLDSQALFNSMSKTESEFFATLQSGLKHDSAVWIEQHNVPVFDDAGHLIAIEGVARDVSERKRAEEQLRESVEKLNRTLDSTILAMARIVEMRDPYTAGHQLRVANLAAAIAEEMGYAESQVVGVRMAASIHDVGKVAIPAEILSKPGRLTDIEFAIIKTHSEVGHEILKTVEFPWPIAEIVLQHHERIDGSGYPRGLTDGRILPEARIVAIADVIEAMASHRPYRPAIGIERAMEEISRNRGRLYDEDAANACLRLFAEKGFSLG